MKATKMMRSILSVGYSALLSLRHLRELGVKVNEYGRYFAKSANFSLCYLGFRSNAGLRQAVLAGRAAFLCCAYDVVTDWRDFATDSSTTFRRILRAYAPPNLSAMAMDLYSKDKDGLLGQDGLERGAIAFNFVIRMMGSESFYARSSDCERIGVLLQLVDDILDYEQDSERGDLNCLNSERRDFYISLARSELTEDFVRLFSSKSILPKVIREARQKAGLMRMGQPSSVLRKTHPAPVAGV